MTRSYMEIYLSVCLEHTVNVRCSILVFLYFLLINILVIIGKRHDCLYLLCICGDCLLVLLLCLAVEQHIAAVCLSVWDCVAIQ